MPRIDVLLLELLVIIFAVRILGALFHSIHQPRVLGEIVAGILLGPSLLGAIAPASATWLFPAENIGALYALSQLGLVLFMFHIGLEVDTGAIRRYGRTAIVVSNVSMLVPFALGFALARWILPSLAGASGPRFGFQLFTGVAMSITAFPVLARILEERGLLHSRVGAIAIACAAVDDVSAWCVLAVIVTVVRSEAGGSLTRSFLALAVYAVAMFWGVRPLARRWFRSDRSSPAFVLSVALMLLLASAVATEFLEVHALFGAFMAGFIMPREEALRRALSAAFAPLSKILLLPVFFAFTGLRTRLGLVHGARMWLCLAVVLTVAIAGKFVSSMFAARVNGLPWRESAALGALLNTRGLIELVILNIGYDLGVISKEMFTLMVIMALVTTFMTTPLLSWLHPHAFGE